jgi:hypothetical protein
MVDNLYVRLLKIFRLDKIDYKVIQHEKNLKKDEKDDNIFWTGE